MGWKKLVLIGAVLGAAYYFLKKNSSFETVEDEEGEVLGEDGKPITRTYVTLDRDALKEKAGDVIDKVAPIIDDTREKISPIINAAKEKVNSILSKPEDGEAEAPAEAEAGAEAKADEKAEPEAAGKEEDEFFDDEDEGKVTP